MFKFWSMLIRLIRFSKGCTYLTLKPCVPESVSLDVGGRGNPFGPTINE